MTVPNLPTDNVYKFVCLSGLTLVVSTILYYTAFNFDALLKNADLRTQMEMVNRKRERLYPEIEAFHQKAKALQRSKELESVTAAHQEGLEIKPKLAEYESALADSLKFGNQVMVYNDKVKFLRRTMVAGVGTGFVMMVIGFCFWYSRVQKYQDRILRNEATQRGKP